MPTTLPHNKTLTPLFFPKTHLHSTMAALTRLFRATPQTSSLLLRRTFCSSSPSTTPTNNPKPILSRPDLKDRNVHWIFLGCPGVGKGTYASRLCKLLGVPHIATGDLVRDELKSTGPLATELKDIVNSGKLVSDEIIINLLSKRLEAGVTKGESGFILDGFPRTIKQAEILEGVTDIDLVVNLKLREDVLVEKCLGRRICTHCGKNYNVACIDFEAKDGHPAVYMAPLLPPPSCASTLITRADDTEEVVKERLRIYKDMCQPVEEFYRSRGKMMEFDLPGGIPESWPKLLQALNLEEHEERRCAVA